VLALSDDGRELTVRCGLMRLTLELAAIEGLHGEKPSPPEVQVQVKGQRGLGGRGASVRSERNTVDVRGLRVHEAEAQLEERLRQANGPVWVIHGIGTGKLESICLGLGVPREHVRVINPIPKEHDENVRVLREEICEHDGVSVVIARRECLQTLRRKRA